MVESGRLHAMVALSLRKEVWYPLHRSLGGPRSRSGFCEVIEKSRTLTGNRTPGIQPVATPTELSGIRPVVTLYLDLCSRRGVLEPRLVLAGCPSSFYCPSMQIPGFIRIRPRTLPPVSLPSKRYGVDTDRVIKIISH